MTYTLKFINIHLFPIYPNNPHRQIDNYAHVPRPSVGWKRINKDGA